jgi:tetraacyldisaccharide 4'-kinase
MRPRNFLYPLAAVYGYVTDLRNALYDRGVLRSYSLSVRTISIGNLTAGGTGKTPLVALTARILADSGEKVCVLTRGYGRANEEEKILVSDGESLLDNVETGGDEPVELARKLIGRAVVVADADRVEAAKWAKERFGTTVFILDDAFQHRRAKRDLDIVCVDAMKPLTGILPAGELRERPSNLRRADAIVITRADLARNIEDLKSQILDHAPGTPIFRAENVISGITRLEEYRAKPNRTRIGNLDEEWKNLRAEGRPEGPHEEVRLFAFCGLGNPDNFFQLLRGEFEKEGMVDFDLSVTKALPDHHSYTQQDIDDLEKQAREREVDALVTTAKDAVKLKDLKFEIPCYVVEVEPSIDRRDEFRRLVTSS